MCAAHQRREPSPTAIPRGFQHTALFCLRHHQEHQEHGSTDLCTGTGHTTSVPVSGKRTTFGSGARSVPHWGVFLVGGQQIPSLVAGLQPGPGSLTAGAGAPDSSKWAQTLCNQEENVVYNFNCYHVFPCISFMTL